MKKSKIIILLILLINLTGCINYTELNELGIIDMIIIDKKEDTWQLNINMVIPKQDNPNNSTFHITTGKTLSEAINNIYLQSSKKVYLAHLNALGLTQNLTNKDIDIIIDFFLSRNDSRGTFYVIYFDNYNNQNTYLSEDIINLIESNQSEKANVAGIYFDEVIQNLLELKTSYIPSVDSNLKILGYQKIYQNTKSLSKEESFALNILTNKVNTSYISLENNINIKINSINTNIIVNQNKINLTITSSITNDKEKYNEYLKTIINNYLDNNTLEYFTNLIKKYNYQKYKDNNITPIFSIKYITKINNTTGRRNIND